MVLCGRRLTRQTQFMGGCLTQPMQMRTDTPDTMTFSEVVQNAIRTRTQLYKHPNFPYMDALNVCRKIYHFGQAQGDALMMLTWLPLDKMNEIFGTKVDLQWYPLDRYIMPLYTFTYINVELNQLQFEYRYRTNLISLQNINDLHESCIKAILMGIDNPDLTLREIYDTLDGK